MARTDREKPPARPTGPATSLGAGSVDLASVLPYAIVRAGAAMERAFATAMKAIDLTPRQFGILTQFAAGEPTTAASIARALGVTPQGIATQIDGLHDRGLLLRIPRRGQGRPNELRLTDHGLELLGRALDIARVENDKVTQDLTATQQRSMLAQLEQMAARAIPPS